MAKEDDLQTPYPPPPLFYKNYTNQVVALPLNERPPDLLPPPPITGAYTVFGVSTEKFESLKSLKELGLTELVRGSVGNHSIIHIKKGHETKSDLKRLNASLCVSFVELLELLSAGCSQDAYKAKLEEIKVLFINFHHLLNAYREHQARDMLEVILQRQIQRRQQFMVELREERKLAKEK